MTIKILSFTCCGHCPLAIVKLRGKCEPMDVYCPLRFDADGTHKKVYSSHLLDKLDLNCPIPSLETWQAKLSELKSKEDREDFVIKTRFFSHASCRSEIEYSRSAFRGKEAHNKPT